MTGAGGKDPPAWAARLWRWCVSAAGPYERWRTHDDDRADALRALGADVVVRDLTRPADVATALGSVQRMFLSPAVLDRPYRVLRGEMLLAREALRDLGVPESAGELPPPVEHRVQLDLPAERGAGEASASSVAPSLARRAAEGATRSPT